ncbi:unnamed protein product [Candidula unifasciata]|uniref:Uncharacterized protein n=1 Tax=Candidula unifasciata TaxID=100452 RepID=A0A8S3ZHB5_9EUPU|nr:unnamed protein product [Candidula unifasciata]
MAKLAGFVYMLLLLTAQPLVVQGFWYELVGAAAGVALVTVGAPVILGAAGFSAGGIVGGSLAAKLMSAKVGMGVVSVLQSTGAAGLGYSTIVAGGVAGAGAGHYAGSHAGRNKDEN